METGTETNKISPLPFSGPQFHLLCELGMKILCKYYVDRSFYIAAAHQDDMMRMHKINGIELHFKEHS